MTTRKIACCGAKVWTRVIAALNGATQTLHAVFEIMRFPSDSEVFIQVISLIIIVANFVGVGLNVILFKGSLDRKPEYLHAWMVVAAVSAAAMILLVPGTMIIGAWAFTFVFAISAALAVFSIWVVSVHKEEMVSGLKSDLNPI